MSTYQQLAELVEEIRELRASIQHPKPGYILIAARRYEDGMARIRDKATEL